MCASSERRYLGGKNSVESRIDISITTSFLAFSGLDVSAVKLEFRMK